MTKSLSTYLLGLLTALLPLAALAADPAADAYRRAHACLTSNRFAEAAMLFETAAHSTNAPAAAAAWLGRGEALYGAKQWPAAIAAYDALLARYPTNALAPSALCGRGFAETQAGLLPQALATFSTLAETYRGHALAATAAASTGSLARTLAAQARHRQTEALARDLDSINTLTRNGSHAESSAAAERFLREHPDHPQAAHLRLLAADGAFRAGDWPRAEATLRAFLTHHSQHAQAPRAQLQLGRALCALGRFAEAADAFAQAADREAPLLCAESLLKAGRTADALARYESLARAAAEPSARARAALAAGDCHAALKHWDEAERAFLSVEILQSADELRPIALAHLADLYDKRGQTNQAARARDDLRRRYPGQPNAQH
jgi:tetratricopeptide (TPR) repeat protein